MPKTSRESGPWRHLPAFRWDGGLVDFRMHHRPSSRGVRVANLSLTTWAPRPHPRDAPCTWDRLGNPGERAREREREKARYIYIYNTSHVAAAPACGHRGFPAADPGGLSPPPGRQYADVQRFTRNSRTSAYYARTFSCRRPPGKNLSAVSSSADYSGVRNSERSQFVAAACDRGAPAATRRRPPGN